MSAGAWVFPISMGLFVVFLSAYLISNPAQPNPLVDYGDRLTLDIIEYYGTEGVARTTHKNLHVGSPYPPVLEEAPWTVTMPPTKPPAENEVIPQFIGKREGQSFETVKLPDFFGNWANPVYRPPLTHLFARDVDLPGFVFAPYPRNFTTFMEDAKGQGVEVHPGTIFRCEGEVWTCRITAVDGANETVSFRREVAVGQELRLRDMHARGLVDDLFHYRFPPPDAVAVVHQLTDRVINVTLQFRPGDAFTLVARPPGWDAGGYRVSSVNADGSYWTHYLPFGRSFPPPGQNTDFPAYVVGEPVWYRITVVKIEKPSPAPSP